MAVADLLEPFVRKGQVEIGVLGGRCRPFSLLRIPLVSFVAVLWFHCGPPLELLQDNIEGLAKFLTRSGDDAA
ncbi:hypothetical protein [Bradyrhizobium sp. Ghvi]|uniref:hypothetical protein n=1 Tax=Bradyrhizobium sp. Ghvi TaxID=1855319 RepID=UPI0015A5B024|nr:hypothetical protein [Bradyrhizobium sp. Ghvi]